jgi:hypothetical protein
MNRFVSILGLLALAACSSKDGDTSGFTDGDADGVIGDTCDVEGVAVAYPTSDGATDFYYRGAVEFAFDGMDDEATITVSDAGGNALEGGTSWVGNNLVFQPSAPLAAQSDYSATLSHCAGDSTVSFRTSDIGSALEGDASTLVGNTYVVSLEGARFVKPAGVGSLLLGMLEQDILLGVVSVSDTEIEMNGALSETTSSAQDRCEPSIDFPDAADFTGAPFFSIGPQDTTLSAGGYDVAISQLQIAGDFTSDGSQIGGAILSGEIDARDLVGALVGGGLLEEEDPDAVCDLIGTFGVACETCASDGADYCLAIYVDQITANADDQTLVAQEECDPEACAEGCEEAG